MLTIKLSYIKVTQDKRLLCCMFYTVLENVQTIFFRVFSRLIKLSIKRFERYLVNYVSPFYVYFITYKTGMF